MQQCLTICLHYKFLELKNSLPNFYPIFFTCTETRMNRVVGCFEYYQLFLFYTILLGLSFMQYDKLDKYKEESLGYFTKKSKSLPQTLIFKSLYLCNPLTYISQIFTAVNSVGANNSSLKCQRFSDCKDIGIIRFEFIAKTQFLCNLLNNKYSVTDQQQ